MKRFKLSPANGGFYGRFAAKMMIQRDNERKENTRLREALQNACNALGTDISDYFEEESK